MIDVSFEDKRTTVCPKCGSWRGACVCIDNIKVEPKIPEVLKNGPLEYRRLGTSPEDYKQFLVQEIDRLKNLVHDLSQPIVVTVLGGVAHCEDKRVTIIDKDEDTETEGS